MEACCSRFTAAEGGARLAAAAATKNILAVEYASFVPVRLLYEKAYQIRGPLVDGRKRSAYVTRASRVDLVSYELKILTDLSVVQAKNYEDVEDWSAELNEKEVIVGTAIVLKRILEEELLSIPNINVLILDSCHMIYEDTNLKYIMQKYKQCNKTDRPLILALTYPLFTTNIKDDDTTEISQDTTEKDNNSESETCEIENDKTHMKNCESVNEIVAISEENKDTTRNDKIVDVECEVIAIKDDESDVEAVKSKDTAIGDDETDLKAANCGDIAISVDESDVEAVKSKDTAIRDDETNLKPANCEDIVINVDESDVEAVKSKDTAIGDDETNLKPANCEDIVINVDESDVEAVKSKDTAIGDDETNLKAANCDDIAITDGKSESESNCMEIAIIDKRITKDSEEIAIGEDSPMKRLQIRVDKDEVIGAYENLDDFDMYEKLEWKIEELEDELCCEMDLAEDIDGGKRLLAAVTKPRELIIEYGQTSDGEITQAYRDLENYMKNTVEDTIIFLQDHRHDPTEIYGDELYEEFINIPDPTIDPKHMLNQFLYVLEQLGPYAADKAAFSLLTKLEKLKIKVPYERHFLLYCLCTTVFIKIRCYADSVFSGYENDWDKIRLFSTPKVLRFAEILELFQPPDISVDKAIESKLDIDRSDTISSGDMHMISNVDIDGKDITIVSNDNDCKSDTVSSGDMHMISNVDIDGKDIPIVSNDNDCKSETVSSGDMHMIGNVDIDGKDIPIVSNDNDCKSETVSSGDMHMIGNVDIDGKDIPIVSNDNDSKCETIRQSDIGRLSNTNIEIDKTKADIKIGSTIKMLNELELCNFSTLGNRIQDKVHTYEANLSDININYSIRKDISGTDNGNNTKDQENTVTSNITNDISDIDSQNILANIENTIQMCSNNVPGDSTKKSNLKNSIPSDEITNINTERIEIQHINNSTSNGVENIDSFNLQVQIMGNFNHSVQNKGNFNHSVQNMGNLNHNVQNMGNLNHSVQNVGNLNHSVQNVDNLNHSVQNVGNLNHSVQNMGNLNHNVQNEGNLNHNVQNVGNLNHNVQNEGNLNHNVQNVGNLNHSVQNMGNLNHNVQNEGNLNHNVQNVGNLNHSVQNTGNLNHNVQNMGNCNPNMVQNVDNTLNGVQKGVLGFTRRAGHRVRGRTRVQRNNAARVQQFQLNPDALCGIVYMKEALMAKIMFMLIVDMSRSNTKLAYLCAQYCGAEPAALSATEPRECQRQGKKQEEVLKKFRMHECNLLLATPALEEGIDLPRCNLVLRWDIPPSYRSYGACRGRARAGRAAAGALSAGGGGGCTPLLLHNMAVYRELDLLISRKCGCGIQNEPPQTEEDHADTLTGLVKPYTPNDNINTRKKYIDDSEKSVIVCKTEEMHDKSIEISKTDVKNEENIDNITVIFNKNEETREKSIETNKIDIKNEEHIDNITVIFNKNEETREKSIETNKSDIKNEESNDMLIKDNQIHDKIINNSNIKDTDSMNNDLSVKTDGVIDVKINAATNDITDIYKSAGNESDSNVTENKEISEQTNIMKAENSHINTINNRTNDINHYVTNLCNNSNLQVIKSDIDVRDIDNIVCNSSGNIESCVHKSDINVNGKDISVDKCDIKKNIDGTDTVASVDLNTAIALINRYCGKLPSDTFTRLAPQWWVEEVHLPVPGSSSPRPAYICTLRLPLNCPVKYNIVGHPMPTKVLARRMVALQACRILHKSGELDNQLMPIGKENFKAAELEGGCGGAGEACGADDPADAARPGTTKRRQYYYKRTAWAFTDCQPIEDAVDPDSKPGDQPKLSPPPTMKDIKPTGKRNMLYAIVSRLCCALPERYNTRGRRLHAPQHASQAIGILMARHEPDSLQIPAFPVYTRSGEVRVSVEYVPDADVLLTPRRAALIRRYMRFVFSEVLRVRRRGMRLASEGSTHNNYYIVPTHKSTKEDGSTKIDIDWSFLELIYQHTEDKNNSELEKPIVWRHGEEDDTEEEVEKEAKEKGKEGRVKKMENPLLKPGETFSFDPEKYKEAVVTPWYRNQDQPQFFLVAEICWNLTPDSAFPSAAHSSFRDYYTNKYGVNLTQADQPLLDVDHTSARLNLLTPRYVNRKGVALPVSSERTRRAKRDRLDQKQILVPELCRLHPFAAPLWFATVALPCVLYRINALLIADEIRRAVAIDVGLGIPKISESTMPGFQWPPLDFGWSLAEVLSADSEKIEKKKEDDESKKHKEIRDNGVETSHKVDNPTEDIKEKTLNDILQQKLDEESGFEIGTWSNDMASSIPTGDDYDEYMEPLPPNLTFCTSASGGANWYDPIEKPKSQFNPSRAFSVADSDCSFISSDLDSDDSDLDYDGSDDDTDTSGFCSSKNSNAAMGVRIEYKTAHEAEAVDLETVKGGQWARAPPPDPADERRDRRALRRLVRAGPAPRTYIQKFRESVARHKEDIITKGNLIRHHEKITHILPPTKDQTKPTSQTVTDHNIIQLFPYTTEKLDIHNGQIDIESIERNKRVLLQQIKDNLSEDEIKKMNCFSMVDIDIDSPDYVNEKLVNVGFDTRQRYECVGETEFEPYYQQSKGDIFDFDYQPKLEGHPGPSPSVILQALTMSNANDGINLERLETIGDSFLKFAITAYLYCAHPTVHEGKLSHMRSKQVSNLNLYRLGRSKRLGARMIASKFEPHDNWLPPCHKPPHTQHHAQVDTPNPEAPQDATGCFIPYNLITQHSIPDKSIADCVEALIGAYLLECGPRGALLFMAWLGIRVLPCHRLPLHDHHPYVERARAQKTASPSSPRRQRSTSISSECSSSDEECGRRHEPLQDLDWSWRGRQVGSLRPYQDDQGRWMQPIFGELKAPPSPLLRYIEDPEGELEQMLSGYDALEETLQYRFKDRSLLLQAMTHASHHSNRLTDCYQRLEFLGDAILDYLITRHLYEDPRRHSPGALTDLRSALVNNTIFATLAARHGFHKYFRHMSPGLNEVLTKYVKIQEENGHSISEEHYLIQEDEMEQAEDVEVPKALGDLFESVAGAIFLDSGMSLGAVWRSYERLMGAELEAFSAAAPKSPVRELLEAEPDTAKFGKPERLADGRRVRVCVEVFGRGAFKGVGRNYRIAKGTAARCALRHLRARRPR